MRTEINWPAKLYIGWGDALTSGAGEGVSFLERRRRRHRTRIAADALHQGIVFALAYPWMARALEEAASAFMTPEYRERLRQALEEAHINAQLELLTATPK